MELGLQGKRALVTGASRGLGRAVARALAHEGCHVAALARTERDLQSLIEEMGGNTHSYYACDLTAPGAVAEALSHVKQNVPFDVVIHALGGSGTARDPLSSWQEWNHALYFNAGVAIEINNHVIPSMKENKWGRVVHISSISGEHLRGNPLYATAKSFLTNYATVLGRSLAEHGVVVSSVLPGAFAFPGSHWDSVARQEPEKMKTFLEQHMARGKIGSVDEIVPFVLLLASEHATFAQGAIINVDGGTK